MATRKKLCIALFVLAAIFFVGFEKEKDSMEPSEQLKALDWLVGNWENKDENNEVAINFKWDPFKKFLIQHFKSKIEGKDEIDGEQIIGWDPAKKKIRSWIFDSDGGFGETEWSREGDSWYSRTAFTLPDGRQASAVHIYTKIDPNTYTFLSESRDIDGQMLPNSGPFKIIRK